MLRNHWQNSLFCAAGKIARDRFFEQRMTGRTDVCQPHAEHDVHCLRLLRTSNAQFKSWLGVLSQASRRQFSHRAYAAI
jgi:hypothetical protein